VKQWQKKQINAVVPVMMMLISALNITVMELMELFVGVGTKKLPDTHYSLSGRSTLTSMGILFF
jgi:hypothetical protein